MNGKPLYTYVINSLLNCKSVDKIIINTDIKEVLDKYKDNNKFILLERPEHLKGNCSMNLVIEDCLTRFEGKHFLQLHVSTPLLTSETIDRAVEAYFKNIDRYDSLFSVTEMQMRFFDKNWKPINHKLEDAPTTQDLDPWYQENCILYIFSRDSFNKQKHRIGSSPYLFKTPLIDSIDLDTEEQFEFAELLLKGKSIKNQIFNKLISAIKKFKNYSKF